MDDAAIQRAREGLNGLTRLSIFYYVFLLLAQWVRLDFHLPVLFNRMLSLGFFVAVRRRFGQGKIAPQHYHLWSTLLGIWGLASLSLSYYHGAITHIAARIAIFIVFSALIGIPRRFCLAYQVLCLGTCAYLQIYHPSATDPCLDLAIPAVGMIVANGIFSARLQTAHLLQETQQELTERGQLLEETLARAQHLQRSLDADVAMATQDLEQTNQLLQQAIDQQVSTFEENQTLHRQVAEALCFQALGKAAGAAAHDFNNLLSVIACSLELIEDEIGKEAGGVKDSFSHQALALLSGEINRSMKVGREILAVSGKQIVRRELFAAANWLKSFAHGLPRLLGPTYAVEASLPEGNVWLHCDRGQLTHALTCLVKNAAEAMPQGGAIVIRTRLEPEQLKLLVEDQGGGLTVAALPHLFEPFYTTKKDLDHSGLGLAAARAIVRQQGGDITYLAPARPGGATFCLRLPISKAPS